jgi:hypothetical protein
MPGKSRDFRNPHNRLITNYLGPGPLSLDELTNHIAGSFLPPVPEHLVQYQEEIRKKKSNVSHFFSILEETFVNAGLSPRLENLLNQSFKASKIEETKITPVFLENLMEALDILKTRFPKDSQDNVYLDKLITTIFSFYKLLKNR